MPRYTQITSPLPESDPRHSRMLVQQQTASLRYAYFRAVVFHQYNLDTSNPAVHRFIFTAPASALPAIEVNAVDLRDESLVESLQPTWIRYLRAIAESWKFREWGPLYLMEDMKRTMILVEMMHRIRETELFQAHRVRGCTKSAIPCLVRRHVLSFVATRRTALTSLHQFFNSDEGCLDSTCGFTHDAEIALEDRQETLEKREAGLASPSPKQVETLLRRLVDELQHIPKGKGPFEDAMCRLEEQAYSTEGICAYLGCDKTSWGRTELFTCRRCGWAKMCFVSALLSSTGRSATYSGCLAYGGSESNVCALRLRPPRKGMPPGCRVD